MIALVAAARAAVTFEAPPEVGVETVIGVSRGDGVAPQEAPTPEPAAGETVRVVVRPGLAGAREVAVGITDARGRVRWTPDTAGVVRVRAGDEALGLVVAGPPPPVTAGLLGALALAAAGLGVVGLWRRA